MSAWLGGLAPVAWAANLLGVQPMVVVSAGLLWSLGFLLWGFTGELVCTVVGLLYPMYASFKALEDLHQDHDQEEANTWLTYWVTYAAMTLAESVFYRVLVWLPFYHIMRLVFIVWLFLPATRGARWIYRFLLGPLLRRYRPRLDAALVQSKEQIAGAWQGGGGEKLCGELQKGFRSAVAGSSGSLRDLGIDDLLVQGLAKTAAGHVASQGADPNESPSRTNVGLNTRTRTASPSPRSSFYDAASEVR